MDNLFKRIDEYYSIAYHGEELDFNADFWKDKEKLHSSEIIKHDSFPAHQDGVQVTVFMDDDYTYIVNTVLCSDNHISPPFMATVIRFDKTVNEEV